MRWLARWLGVAVTVVGMLGGCASVPDTDHLGGSVSQKRFATDSGWSNYNRGQDIVKKLDAQKPAATADGDFLARHLQVEEAISGAPLMIGNRVTLLTDGPRTYDAMLRDIRAARQFIHMESYIFDDDEVGRMFADAFIAKRAEGVAVALMVDGVGTLGTPDALFKRMRDAGVQVVVFNPVNPARAKAGWAPNNRDHRKLLVVDGKVGFLGGINISAVYASAPSHGGSAGSALSFSGGSKATDVKADGVKPGDAKSDDVKPDGSTPDAATAPWRDTHIRVEGPAVGEIERVMQQGWAEQHGPPLDAREFYPRATPTGPTAMRIVANRPGDKDGYTLYLTLISAIKSAQRSIHITMAYFVPDPAFVQALTEAARRGVDVGMVLPGFSDSSLVWHAGRSYYTPLLDAGAHLYERRDAMLHAKTAVIDGVWSTVGSSNMDWRSFALNYELNAVILGPEFGGEMEALFKRDVADATPISKEEWSQRGFDERFMEAFSRLFERWL
ncbi:MULTISPECIES: phosphatidylserine/phosphatidylglycerophosphate/cardiolipin synthase family protein [unclassified Achromobacter]|uniref:phospholipase D-like domain-containing protein n=1 Tax=unclassified Achromobacter TaxID=2626865 RepID=UPI000B517B48|nr:MULTISPECIES: phospholipase D-like domain-containing protein [unclassified Achromobacter]OWT67931.1 cardiolipin synthase B [Achromobacter sp. HZ34]OWT67995.1 cardiolipin synthase B [Achromobacter sp. HZ28]